LNSLLSNWIAQVESWEAAIEFGIPRQEWARYDVVGRTEDVYVASLAQVFDALRIEDATERNGELSALAKALLVYSRSSAARYLPGVRHDINLLYAATLFYLAGYPATAALIAREAGRPDDAGEEEELLVALLRRDLNGGGPLVGVLSAYVARHEQDSLTELVRELGVRRASGLQNDPRQFIAATFATESIRDFSVTNIWQLLATHAEDYTPSGWAPFFSNSQGVPMWDLLPSQREALARGLMGPGRGTVSIQMPTSSGKTALCELLIYHEVKIHRRPVLFLVPFRALAAEIREGMSQRLSSAGVSVVASHGGNIPSRSGTAGVEDAGVLITTPEKFAALEQVVDGLSVRFMTIICDEGHLIDDQARGLGYELLLTKLRNESREDRRFVFISAILPNVGEIHEWLGGSPEAVAMSDYRPVDVDHCFIREDSKGQYRLDVNPTQPRPRNYFLRRFLIQDDFRYLNLSTGRHKLIHGWSSFVSLACAAALKARRAGPVALFTTTRGTRNGVAALANKMLEMLSSRTIASRAAPPLSHGLPGLIQYLDFQFGTDYLLSRLARFGVAYHHGRLPQEIRRVVEQAIQAGTVNTIICTTTLAEGVNLPIRTMVVHTVRRYNVTAARWHPIPRRTIKNIIGRAGRAGKETRGRVIFTNWNERAYIEDVLRDLNLEPATGALFRLVEALHSFCGRTGIELSNDIFDAQPPSFLALIDRIDHSLLDLMPADMSSQDVAGEIQELLEQTLAYRNCTTPELIQCLQTVFRLRAARLEESVERSWWPKLKKSGTTPRFWQFVGSRSLLEHSLWLGLQDPLADEWLNEVIAPLFDYPAADITGEQRLGLAFVRGWMTGETYAELAVSCECEVDAVLDLCCHTVGYVLQDCVGKLCLLARETRDEGELSELAAAWPSLLQFGLSSLRQLDLFERGVSDRLAVWGVERYLLTCGITLRGRALVAFLRGNAQGLRYALEHDERVPAMSMDRLSRELELR
jgi:helicase